MFFCSQFFENEGNVNNDVKGRVYKWQNPISLSGGLVGSVFGLVLSCYLIDIFLSASSLYKLRNGGFSMFLFD